MLIEHADEGGHGTGIFLAEFGEGTIIHHDTAQSDLPDGSTPTLNLYRLSDFSGTPSFSAIEPPITFSSLSSSDAFILDNTLTKTSSAVLYVWLGAQSSLTERRLAVQYAQRYLHDKIGVNATTTTKSRNVVAIPIVKMQEGHESEAFLALLRGEDH